MKGRNKKILTALTVIALLIVIIINVILLKKSSVILFFDNASFNSFQTYKVENFTLDQEETVSFEFAINIEEGEVLIRVYDDNDNEIIKIEELNYEDEFTKILVEGNYIYELELIGVKNGSFRNKAFIERNNK